MISLSSFFLIAVAAAQIAVPPLKSRVTDLTGTLNAQQRSALEQTLAEFEARKGSQVAVLMVPSTQPETVEQYAVRVQESWKLGRKGVDDGVLLLVAKDDRRLRIEVGYGLEGPLPDAVAKRIIEEDITPRFKQGDFYGGIRAGTDRIMRVIEGEPLPAPGSRSHGTTPILGFALGHLDWVIGGLFLLAFVGHLVQAAMGRALGSALIGGAIGFGVWMIAASLLFAIVSGVLAFVLMLMTAGWSGSRYLDGSGGWGGGGWSSGGGGDFGGGGGGSGGGGSGGGGASGSW